MSKFKCVEVDVQYPGRFLSWHTDYIRNKACLPQKLKDLKTDPVLFIEMCCYCVSRNLGKIMQKSHFELFPAQKAIINDIHAVFLGKTTFSGVVISKSRQMGCSWLMAAYAAFVALFFEDQQIYITSKLETDIHRKGIIGTFMGKIEYFINNLPQQIKKSCLLYYKPNLQNLHINRSVIIGATGAEGVRSTTPSLLINDEFAFNPFAEEVIMGAVPACNCSIFLSTLNIPNNTFDKLRQQREVYQQIEITVRNDDPRVTDYEDFKKRKTSELGGDIKKYEREYELKYDSSRQSFVFPWEWVNHCCSLKPEDYTLSEDPKIIGGLDIAAFGFNDNSLTIRKSSVIIYARTWNEGLSHKIVNDVLRDCELYNVDELYFDEIGVGTGIVSEFDRRASDLPPNLLIEGVVVGKKAEGYSFLRSLNNADVYADIRAQLHDILRTKIQNMFEKKETVDNWIFLRGFPELIKEIQSAMYSQNGLRFKMQIMSKKEYKSAGFKSPDSLDSLLLTYFAEIKYNCVNLYEY